MSSEHDPDEEIVTPGVAADDEEARLKCMTLLAEMEAMDKESERLQTMLEVQQMRSMLAALTEVSGNAEAVSAVRSTMEATMVATPDSNLPSPESVMASSEPSSPATTTANVTAPPADEPPTAVRTPRRSNLSQDQRAQLAGLLEEDVVDESVPRGELYTAQTGTLRRLMSGSVPPSQLSQTAAPLMTDVERALLEARANFSPDTTAMDAEIARMEKELRSLQLEKEIREGEAEMRRLQRLIAEAPPEEAQQQ